MQARLTDKAVERFAPKPTRYEVHDTYLTGLSLRVTDKGRKSWYVMYRLAGAGPGGIKGKLIRLKVGDYPLMDLTTARDAAKEVLQPAEYGRDARLERVAQREVEQTRTFEAKSLRQRTRHPSGYYGKAMDVSGFSTASAPTN